MEQFLLYNPTKLYFGRDQIQSLKKEISPYNRVLLVYGGGSIKKSGLYDEVIHILKKENKELFELSGVEPNPRITSVNQGIEMIKRYKIDLVLAVGGGSTIDCAKAIVISVYSNDPLETILKKNLATHKGVALGSILTLSATGSEMNPRSVISDMDQNLKLGIGLWESNATFPDFSICDPTYTLTVPRNQTLNGIVDIMAHVLEQYFTKNENAVLGDKIAESILTTMIEIAPKLLNDLNNYELRETMMISGTLAWNGLLRGLLNKGDWSCHRLEHALSAIYDIPHGEGLAILFPVWMDYVKEIRADQFRSLAENVFKLDVKDKSDYEAAVIVIAEFKKFLQSLGAPLSMNYYNIQDYNIEELIDKTLLGQQSIGRYVQLTSTDLYKIFERIF